jgi:dihydrofolate reductase
MIKSMIVAVSENEVIGKDNQLIWHLPADLKFFKSLTMGHHMIMGRKTFDSIGKALPGRTSIIITRNKNYTPPEGCLVAYSLEEAINKANENKDSEAFIIGGAEIFKQAEGICDKIYYTEVKATFDGDTFFHLDKLKWKAIKREDHLKDEKNKFDYSFVEYLRIAKSQ